MQERKHRKVVRAVTQNTLKVEEIRYNRLHGLSTPSNEVEQKLEVLIEKDNQYLLNRLKK